MRNLILIAVAAAAFCAVGMAQPNVLIAQDSVEEDLASDRPVARNRPDSGEEVGDRRENFRDRGAGVSDRREDRPDRQEGYRDRSGDRHDRRENYQDQRGNRRAHQRDFQDHRGFRRDHQRDFRAHRGVRGDHKRYYSSRPDRGNRSFAKRHRYAHSARSYRGGGWGKVHSR